MDEGRSEAERFLRDGRMHMRRARLTAFLIAAVITVHLELLVVPYAASVGGLEGALIIGYPLLLVVLLHSTISA